MLSQEFLYRLEDEINRARFEIDEKHMGRQSELRARFDAPDLTVRQAGHFLIINLDGQEITIGSMATDEQIAAEIAKIRQIQGINEKPMPTIAEELKAARAKLAEARQSASSAVAESAHVSGLALEEVAKVVKETEEMRAELAGLNGGPA